MARVFLKRTLSGFTIADEVSMEVCKQFKVGESYAADVVRPRSLPWLRRYWALADLVFQNTEQFPSAEALHGYLKLRCGVFTPVVNKATGEVFHIPGSIAFHRMTDDQFAAFWRKVVEVVTTEIIPGLDSDDLSQEVERLCGVAA